MNRAAMFVLVLVTLAACGEDEGKVPTEILAADVYANRCEAPRKGEDAAGDAFPDKNGSLLDEQLFLRSWIDDTYLWYLEVPRANPKMFDNTLDYFGILRTGVKTASGKDKDQFHFTYTTEEWLALSSSGTTASYGLTWSLLKSTPPRQIVVAYVEPNSPAANAGIVRGTLGVTVDGVDVAAGDDVDTLNAGLFPDAPNVSHTLVVRDPGATTTREVMLTSTTVTSVPVTRIPLAAPNDKIGYLQFNDHIRTAEKGLFDEITNLQAAGITDLVLDLRYNGGGYLVLAAELGYMIGGTATEGKTFETIHFNDKHTTSDPITGAPLTPTLFQTTTVLSAPTGRALPHLDLKRVFILTGPGTCSASEAVMNGLAGADIEVIQIGATTCGKPYGFYAQDNCGTTYFAIQFQGVNAKDFGNYADGFAPTTGCDIADDFTHQIGDPAEARLAAALSYIATGSCQAVAARSSNPLAAIDGVVQKPLWLQNAIKTR